ncbi:carbohydrate-binding protein [Streptomyces sp. NPDC003077]|uniref:carbohydrate-binding protein n=1 Tax=Streptomyces sp. NPDC003077 TaxID=3154443 RepID=UPI0033A34F54
MTAGNNGAGTPENDDPFAYLYRSEGGEGGGQGSAGDGTAPRQPGVPRTSYNHVRAVGERQYGAPRPAPQQQPPGQQQAYGQQQGYGQPNAHYAAPETLPGGDRRSGPPAGRPGAPGQPPRRNRNGLLIGAIAVVVVVCAGIGVAMIKNSGNTKGDEVKANSTSTTAAPKKSPPPEPKGTPTATPPAELPKQDAATLRLSPEASTDTSVSGAKASNGAYVQLNKVGAAVTWSVEIPQDGQYTLFVNYGVPGKDAKPHLSINGQGDRTINMGNFAEAPEGAWDKGWTHTFAYVEFKKGTNTIKISCEDGDPCGVNLDQVSVLKGWVKN